MAEPKGVQDLQDTRIIGEWKSNDAKSNKLNLECVLPKYDISAGRGFAQDAHLSMARLYFDDLGEVLSALGDSNYNEHRGQPYSYIGFLLQQVSENRQEKAQTSPLVGDGSHTTFFGSSPRQYSYTGILLNGSNVRWRELITKLYDGYLRGSTAVSKGKPIVIIYDNKVVSGWLLSLSQTLSSSNEMVVPFSFSIQVIEEVSTTPDDKLSRDFKKYLKQDHTLRNLAITDTNTELPFDDYVRKASIRLPPKAIRGGGGGRCKVKDPMTSKHGESKKTQGPSGPVKADSPTQSSCDMAEAVLYHSRKAAAYQKKHDAARAAGNKKRVATYRALRNKSYEEIKKLQTWAKRDNVAGLEEYNKVLTDAGLTSTEKENIAAGDGLNKLSKYKRKKTSSKVSKAAKDKRKKK
jgi:hypothetical protein